LPHLFKLLSIRRALGARLLAHPPDVFIGIDAPDFNFGLEARLKTAGIPTVHFVSPSFWAWRAGKLANLKASADHVLCIFPFEPAVLALQGIAATYVGHPLASMIPHGARPPLQLGRRWACRRTGRWSPCCRAVGNLRSVTSPTAFLAAARLILQRRPTTRFGSSFRPCSGASGRGRAGGASRWPGQPAIDRHRPVAARAGGL
jgi:lipid-A-disaccharide synthase